MNNQLAPVLLCQDLHKSFDDGTSVIEVLSGITLEVKPRELVAIVGTSGSGKSTLLHLLGGLDKPTSGKVMLTGKDFAELSEREKCKLRNFNLGFVYQFHHLLPEFTALENVGMPLLIRGLTPNSIEQKASYLLEQVGLKNRMTHRTGELSGGERQRVAIARALVTDPLCILADEPTGNLDHHNAERTFEILLEMQKLHQTSIVMVTHDMRLASRAERILQIEDGRLASV